MDNLVIYIPARYKSTRLEGKPLLKINNKTIIQLTYEQAKKCKYANKVIVLTDDERIKNEVEKFNGECMIITDDSDNGTERICCALKQLDKNYDIIVNVQGDEPFIDPDNIDKCIENYINKRKDDKKIVCSTLHKKLISIEEIESCNIGKVTLDYNNNILYCSRTPIPVNKKGEICENHDYYGDIGIFVYDRHYLENNYYKINTKNQLTEDIEWLKILEQGYKVNSYLVNDSERSLDTKEDYNYLLNKYR